MSELSDADREVYEVTKSRFNGSIWTYPKDADPNTRGIYEACANLERAGLMRSRPIGDDVTLFEIVE